MGPITRLGNEFKIINSREPHFLFDKNYTIIDTITEQIEDLYNIYYPKEAIELTQVYKENRTRFVKDYLKKTKLFLAWYPWRKTLVKILPEDDYLKLRCSRNRFLITEEEQKKFANFKVAIAGLSVGNSIASTIRLNGGGKYFNLADFDVLSVTNMNRIRSSVTDLGLNKSEIAKRQLLELDPYTIVKINKTGVTKLSVNKLIDTSDVIIDEVDNLEIKVLLRITAMKKRKPLFMFTDNDDGVLIDYYPYQASFKTLFHGIKNEQVIRLLKNKKRSSKKEGLIHHLK